MVKNTSEELEVFQLENGEMAPIPKQVQARIMSMLFTLDKKPPYTTNDYYQKIPTKNKRTFDDIDKLSQYILNSEYKDVLVQCTGLLLLLFNIQLEVTDVQNLEKQTTFSKLFENYFNNHNFTIEQSTNNMILTCFIARKSASLVNFQAQKNEKNLQELLKLVDLTQEKLPEHITKGVNNIDIFKLDAYPSLANSLLSYNEEKKSDELLANCKQVFEKCMNSPELYDYFLGEFIAASSELYKAYAIKINNLNNKNELSYGEILGKLKNIKEDYMGWATELTEKLPTNNTELRKDLKRSARGAKSCYINQNPFVTVDELFQNQFYIEEFFVNQQKLYKTHTPLGLTQSEQCDIAIMEATLYKKIKSNLKIGKDPGKINYSTVFPELSKIIEKRLNIIYTLYLDFLENKAKDLNLYTNEEDFEKYKKALKSVKTENGVYQTQLGSFYIKISGQDERVRNAKTIMGDKMFFAFGAHFVGGDDFVNMDPTNLSKLLADLAIFANYRNTLHGYGFLSKEDFEQAINMGLFASNNILVNIDACFGLAIKKFKEEHPEIDDDEKIEQHEYKINMTYQ